MQEFQPAVIEALKYYVYCLVNPKDNKIFYIGKGKGNKDVSDYPFSRFGGSIRYIESL